MRSSEAVAGLRSGNGGYDRLMRFPVVLFDLDGTLIDSTLMILASFRHATRTVLGEAVADAEIFAVVGGPTLEAQMRSFSPEHVQELVDVYRAHNTPLHDDLELCAGMGDVLATLKAEGRRLGIVTSKRRHTTQLALDRLGIEPYFEAIVTSDETTTHKPSPEPVLLALSRLGALPRRRGVRRRLALRRRLPPGRPGCSQWRSAGAGCTTPRDADAVVADTEELLAVL